MAGNIHRVNRKSLDFFFALLIVQNIHIYTYMCIYKKYRIIGNIHKNQSITSLFNMASINSITLSSLLWKSFTAARYSVSGVF